MTIAKTVVFNVGNKWVIMPPFKRIPKKKVGDLKRPSADKIAQGTAKADRRKKYKGKKPPY